MRIWKHECSHAHDSKVVEVEVELEEHSHVGKMFRSRASNSHNLVNNQPQTHHWQRELHAEDDFQLKD